MKRVYIINLIILLGLSKVESDELGCLGQHFREDFILSDLLYNSYCRYESFGQNFSTSGCELTEYHSSSTQCWNLEFVSGPLDSITKWTVRPYLSFKNIRVSNYNLTFNNVKWKYMRYRVRPVRNSTHCYCAQMVLSPSTTVQASTTLAFACQLFDETMENQDIELQFSVGESPMQLQGGGLLYFRIPPADSIDWMRTPLQRWRLLLALQRPGWGQLSLHWQPAPPHLQVFSYSVRLLAATAETEQLLTEMVVQAASCEGSCELVLSLPQPHPHMVFATVQLQDTAGWCAAQGPQACVSRTPLLALDDPGPGTLPLLPLLLPLLLGGLVLGCCLCWLLWRPGPPAVLLLYQPLHPAHCRAVALLAAELNSICGAHCTLSDAQVSAVCDSDSGRVDVVLVVASPAMQPQQDWLRAPPADRWLLAVPPYCSPQAVPSADCAQLPPLLLPAQLAALLWQLRPSPSSGLALLLPCLQMHLLGKSCHRLAQAWLAAQQQLEQEQQQQPHPAVAPPASPLLWEGIGCIDDYDLLGGRGTGGSAGARRPAETALSLDSWLR